MHHLKIQRWQKDGRAMKMMKIYNSFLIRCWLLRNTTQADRLVFEIEHIQSGERKRGASLAEIQSLMLAMLAPESEALQHTGLVPTGAPKNESNE
jgi:hypothetical protein